MAKVENKELREKLEQFLEKYSNEEKIRQSSELSDLIVSTIKNKNLYHQGMLFIDTMITSAYLYNIFYNENDFTSLYKLRKIIYEENTFPREIADIICSTVEGQLGAQSPVVSSAPKVGTPTEIFSDCIFFYKLGARANDTE